MKSKVGVAILFIKKNNTLYCRGLICECSEWKLFEWLFSIVLATYIAEAGSFPGRDMSVSAQDL